MGDAWTLGAVAAVSLLRCVIAFRCNEHVLGEPLLAGCIVVTLAAVGVTHVVRRRNRSS